MSRQNENRQDIIDELCQRISHLESTVNQMLDDQEDRSDRLWSFVKTFIAVTVGYMTYIAVRNILDQGTPF